MKLRVLGLLLVAVTVAAVPGAAEEPGGATQTSTYAGANPWSSAGPDCRISPAGKSFGLGGACFSVPEGMDRFRVTVEDEVFGAGYGRITLCVDTPTASLCEFSPICDGVAEGDVPAGATSASVVVYGPVNSFCWPGGLTWAPVHGTITLEFSDSTS